MKKTKAHVSSVKKEQLKNIITQINGHKTIMIVSVKGLPSRQFQDIKKKVRDKAKIIIIKKNILRRAIEETKIDGIKPLEDYVTENCAILYSNHDAFEISGILSRETSPQKAKAGQEAPFDIEVKAGPTNLVPGPDISALSGVGLTPKVEKGKIAILNDKVIAKKGSKITAPIASIMAKLEIIPFKVGIEPVAAFMDGNVYSDIKINSEELVNDILEKYVKSLSFAVEICYVNNDSLDFILAKAKSHEGVLTRIITGEPEPTTVVATPTQTQEVTKEEPKQESAAGLASLFG